MQTVDTQNEYVKRSRYRQRRPYNLVLPYTSDTGLLIQKKGTFTYPAKAYFTQGGLPYTTQQNQAQALAYERFKGQVSDRASMGENLGQLSASVRLIEEKTHVVIDALRRLRRFDVSAFAQWMSKGFVKRNSKFAAQLNLEIAFAIKPSIDDIYSAVNVLQEPIKNAIVKGRATVPFSATVVSSTGTSPDKVASAKVSAEYGAFIAVTNPNLHLADTMGLINPVQTAWQLLPGSFLVDWLLPVEQFLGYMTDFVGLTFVDSYSTVFARGYYYETWRAYGFFGSSSWSQTKRVQGITLPSLRFRPLKIAGVQRAANAVSLLIQAFSKR